MLWQVTVQLGYWSGGVVLDEPEIEYIHMYMKKTNE
jgi:hypothetical protein